LTQAADVRNEPRSFPAQVRTNFRPDFTDPKKINPAFETKPVPSSSTLKEYQKPVRDLQDAAMNRPRQNFGQKRAFEEPRREPLVKTGFGHAPEAKMDSGTLNSRATGPSPIREKLNKVQNLPGKITGSKIKYVTQFFRQLGFGNSKLSKCTNLSTSLKKLLLRIGAVPVLANQTCKSLKYYGGGGGGGSKGKGFGK